MQTAGLSVPDPPARALSLPGSEPQGRPILAPVHDFSALYTKNLEDLSVGYSDMNSEASLPRTPLRGSRAVLEDPSSTLPAGAGGSG